MSCRKFWPVVCILTLLVLLAGCGGGGSSTNPIPSSPPPLKDEFLYMTAVTGSSPANFATIFSTFKIDLTTGALSQTSTGTPFPGITFTYAIYPASKSLSLYVSDSQSSPGSIDIFSISPTTGAPTHSGQLNIAPSCSFCVQPPNPPGPLIMDPSGKFVFYGSNMIGGITEVVGALAADSSGMLSVVPGSPFPADGVPLNITIHPSGKFVYTENTNGVNFALQSISEFSVGANGVLTPIAGSPLTVPAGIGIGSMVYHPSGQFLYTTGAVATTGVSVWSINTTTGELTTMPNLVTGH